MGTVHAKDAGSKTTSSSKNGMKTTQGPCGPNESGKNVNLAGVEARVDKIHIEGLQRTKDDMVIDTVQELFQSRDFQEVIVNAHRVRGKLEDLDCFRNVGIFIDTSTGPEATANGLEVTFFVKELKRMTGGINTMVGNNEGSLVIGLKAPNMMGRGEKLQAEYSYGSKETNNLSISFLKPLRTKYNTLFTASIFQHGTAWPMCGYKHIDRGILFDLSFNSACMMRHNLQYEGAWGIVDPVSKNVSMKIREGVGHSLKSSLRHILTVDRRDSLIFPKTGTLFKYTTELAGLGGDVSFFKNEFYLQHNIPFISDTVLQCTLQGGLLTPMINELSVAYPHKFYLGGPTSIRGFITRGIGPKDDADFKGGHSFWGAGLHLFSPLPFKPGEGGFGDLFRIHLFTNLGNIREIDYENGEDYQTSVKKLFEGIRLSYGIGLAIRLGQMARVELNCVFPHLWQETDTRVGDKEGLPLQFGVGLQFL